MRAFFDTNVIVYAHDHADGIKQSRAASLLDTHARARQLVVGTQVLIEAYSTLVRRSLLSPADALAVVDALTRAQVVSADGASVLRGIRLSQQHRLSHWDGLVVQAALDAECVILFTEDMQAGRRFGELEVVNPFAEAAHEPPVAYRVGTATKRVAKPLVKRVAKRVAKPARKR